MKPQDSQIHFCTVVLSLIARNGTEPVAGRVLRVDVDRPGPGEELNEGPLTVPGQAATVIVLRGGDTAPEVLLRQRNPAARFMAGAWVFPGGAVDGAAARGKHPHRAAAVRE